MQLPAQVGAPRAFVVEQVWRERPAGLKIHDGEVGVAADPDSPFAWVESEHARRRGGGELRDALQGETTFMQALAQQEWQQRLCAGDAVRHIPVLLRR